MKYMKEVLYYLNSDTKIPFDLLRLSLNEWININDEIFSNYFITVLLHGLKFKNYPIEYMIKTAENIYEIDNFDFKKKLMLKTRLNRPIVELCGSGKKGIKTFNISTLSAIVASSIDIPIMKNISSSTSSLSGSSDFLKISTFV